LIVSEQKFKALEKDFQLFFKGLRDRLVKRSSFLGPTRGQLSGPKEFLKAFEAKINSENPARRFRDYEPTAAIYVNECQYRRWCRVNEWFGQYAQGAEEISQRSFHQIKMDT
jgi:hypothetical protein